MLLQHEFPHPSSDLLFWDYLFVDWLCPLGYTSLQTKVFLLMPSVDWTGGHKFLFFFPYCGIFFPLSIVTSSFLSIAVWTGVWGLLVCGIAIQALLAIRVSIEKAGVILIWPFLYMWLGLFPWTYIISCSIHLVFYHVLGRISFLVQSIWRSVRFLYLDRLPPSLCWRNFIFNFVKNIFGAFIWVSSTASIPSIHRFCLFVTSWTSWMFCT